MIYKDIYNEPSLSRNISKKGRKFQSNLELLTGITTVQQAQKGCVFDDIVQIAANEKYAWKKWERYINQSASWNDY